MREMSDLNLQGCSERQNMQREFAVATREMVAAETRYKTNSDLKQRKTLEAALYSGQQKVSQLRSKLAEHTDSCSDCARLR
jgi:hypothetical protein